MASPRGLRRWLFSLNLAVTLAMVGALFILVNFIASRRYARKEFSRSQISALSGKTTQLLHQLKDPVRVIVFYQPTQRLYELIQDLLKEYQREGPKLTVEYVDPEQDVAKAQQLAKEFEIDRINLIVFQSGSRHKYLSDSDLAEFDYTGMEAGEQQPTLKSFSGEDAFSSAILNVTQAQQPLIWVTTGHGEKSVEETTPRGLGQLKKFLERENMKVELKAILEQSEIPKEVSAVVIPGPTKRFMEQELVQVEGYLEHGGRLLAMIDPLQDSGLDGLLSRWGAELGMDIVVDPSLKLPFISPANLLIATYTQHPIVTRIEPEKLITLFPLARSVQPVRGRNGITSTELALTSPDGWGETNTSTNTFQFDQRSDTRGPVPIAVACERSGQPATRLVVIGDSDFVANGQLLNAPGNVDFILGSLHWLAGEEQLIGIGPKQLEHVKLSLTVEELRTIRWLTIGLLPGLFVVAGIVVWWLRRQ
ncbi:MAG: Gldg family protein [Candidatus Omnitrophica bacterium]|nr:Gldg family protein [Candidatus Omnitrophota bacterium]